MLLKLPHAVISSHTHQTAYEISGQITAEVITSVGKCKPRRSREQATTKTSATAPIADLRWNTLTRSHSASEKRLQAQLRTVRIIMTDTMTAAAVCPLGKLGSPGNRPDPIEVTGRGLSTTHLMPVTYSIGVADTTMSLMTILLLPVMRISMAARMTNNMMHPMVENMYASTVEQSCKYSGHVDSACSTRVSRVVTIAEFRSVMPIIGTRPHSMAVAITTAAVPFFVCIPRMVTAYLPSVYLGWRIPPILPRQCSRSACWWWIRKIPGRAKARRVSKKSEGMTVRSQGSSDVTPSREQRQAHAKKAGSQRVPRLNECLRRRVTLPHPAGCSTITVPGLSFRVRKGTGRHTWAMATAKTMIGRNGRPQRETIPASRP